MFFCARDVHRGRRAVQHWCRRWASYFRFIPCFVVGGFLGATGWFLVGGGVRILTGRTLIIVDLTTSLTPIELAKFSYAIITLMVLLVLRRWTEFTLCLGTSLWLAGTFALLILGLSRPNRVGTFLP